MIVKTDSYGNIYYYNDLNQLHREDGPAVEYADGDKFWFLNGQRHREDGPAIEYAYGEKYWYFRGKKIICETNEEFLKLMKLKAFW